MGKRILTGSLLAAAAASLVLAPAAVAEGVSSPGSWVRTHDFQSRYLCQSAGLTGEFFGRWREGEWRCEGTTLFVLQVPSLPGAG
ncbi:hypothetical protein [Amycolatopsis sp. NPDC098790]|uniref:hypothetical protein n=1 Tax=Amycolatopsis sp. NPDC098790 TaxID=3363939 RepID=UPI0038144F9E